MGELKPGDGRGDPARWSWRREAPLLAVILGMVVASVVAWPFADERIPLHWNASGEVDRYGGKAEGLFLLPAMTVGVWLLLAILPRFDPARKNYSAFGGAYLVTRAVVLAFFALLHAGVLAMSLGATRDIYLVLPVAVGVVFIVLGYVMPRFQPNYFAGIRTPWTLASARSWAATHRLGGRVFMAGGVLFIVTGLIRVELFVAVLLGWLGVGVVGLFVYSYRVWRSDPPGAGGDGGADLGGVIES